MKWRTVGLFSVVLMGAGTVQAVVTELQNNKATVVAAFEDDLQSTTSATFVDLSPALQVTVNTPSNGILVMRFSASAFSWTEFPSSRAARPSPSTRTLGLGAFGVGIDQMLAGLTKGLHVVEVQIRSSSAGDQLSVDTAHLTAMSFK